MRQLVLLIVLAATMTRAATAGANGRIEATSSINFRQGNESDIAAGMTFGLMMSHDAGATWTWMCEDAVGYGGLYDPDYAYSPTGALFATTFFDHRVLRDGCTFDVTGLPTMSTETLGPDHALHVGASDVDPADSSIYRSTDDGVTYPQPATPGRIGDWWKSLEVAPSNADIVYLTGYRTTPTQREIMLFRSTDGGRTYAEIPTGSTFALSTNTSLQIAGISHEDPDLVYARLAAEKGDGDALYRSANGGVSWTRIFAQPGPLAFVVRANGDIVTASTLLGAWVSHDRGDTWVPLPTPPHLNCLVENAAGEVWGCTQNYGSNQPGMPVIPSDGAGIMKTTDLVTWTPVLRFQDIKAPVACPIGTIQHDQCELQWCGFKRKLGITSTVIDCQEKIPTPDATPVPPDPSCCGVTAFPRGGLMMAALVTAFLLRPRRRRARPSETGARPPASRGPSSPTSEGRNQVRGTDQIEKTPRA